MPEQEIGSSDSDSGFYAWDAQFRYRRECWLFWDFSTSSSVSADKFHYIT